MRNNENGRSMVEMLGVLAIIGVLSAGGLAGYSKAMFKHKLNNTMDQITMLVTNVRTTYGTQKNYAGLTGISVIDNLGALPAGIKNVAGNTTVYRNPFKGTVDVTATQAKRNVANSGFLVTYTNIPKEACIALATADFGSGAGSGFVGVVVGATENTALATAAQGGGYEPLNLDVYIGEGNGRQEIQNNNNEITQTPQTASRSEGQAYTMGQALNACGEINQIAWKFY